MGEDYILASSDGKGGIMLHCIRPLGPEWTPERIMEEIRNDRHSFGPVREEAYKMAVGKEQITIDKNK